MTASPERTVLQAQCVRPAAAPAASGLDMSCARASVTVVTGPSAAMASRWLEGLAAWRPVTGRLRVLDDAVHDPRELRRRIGYADPQAPLLSTLDVRMNVMLPRLYHLREPRAQAAGIAERILDRIGYAGPRDEPPARLGKLERIQVLLARALALDPPLVIIDEPFDIAIAAAWRPLGERIHALAHEDGRTVLVATRNLAFAAAHADQLVFVDRETARAFGSWSEFAADARVAEFIARLPFATGTPQ